MRKRSNGEGSVSPRENGTWLAQVTISGKRLTKTHKHKREAQDWIREKTGQIIKGLTYAGTQTTLLEAFTDWLEGKCKTIRPKTGEQYTSVSRLYILPSLGDLKLHEINASHIQRFYNSLDNRGVGRRSIEITHIVLHGFFKSSLARGLVSQNWTEMVDVPKPETHIMQVWSEDQVTHFLKVADGDMLFRLALATGMRQGELMGLQWKDIDFQTRILHVVRQVYEPDNGGFRFQPPKTARGTRGIKLGAGLVEGLLRQREKVAALQKNAAAWSDYDLVFPSKVGTPVQSRNLLRAFDLLVKKSGLPDIRFHDMRHTAASIMLLHREPAVRVAYILGEGVDILLKTYAHFIPDGQETASALMDRITLHHDQDKNDHG